MIDLKIVPRNPADLVPYANNAKIHTPEQIDAIAGQISAFGFDQPIVVDKQNVIIKGHGRREAALKLGLKLVPVVTAEHLDEYQAMAARIADNKVASKTGVDSDKLKFDLGTLSIRNFDLNLTGFTMPELKPFKLDETIHPQIIGGALPNTGEPASEREPEPVRSMVIEESESPPPPEDQEEHVFAEEGDQQSGSYFMDRTPVIQYNIIFDTEEQQKAFHAWLGDLKAKYPNAETIAERILQYVADNS